MFYILDSLGYIEATSSHYIECDNKTCTEYKGTIPSGYSDLDDWVLNANIRAYKIDTNGNLIFDASRDTALQKEYANCLIGGNRNLFGKNNAYILNGALNAGNNELSYSDNFRTFCMKIKPNTTYTISKIVSSRFILGFYSSKTDTLPIILNSVIGNNNATKLTITSGATDNYLYVMYSKVSEDTTITQEDILNSIQVEEGSTATSYVPYQTIDGSRVTPHENYSTAEQIIGTWINGKPLYRKIIETTAPETTADGTNKQSVKWIDNIDFGFIEWGILIDQNGNKLTIPYMTSNGYSIRAYFGSYDDINIVNQATAFNGCKIFISLLYTK